MENELNSIKKVVSSLLMVPEGLSLKDLISSYERFNGPIPYKKFGYSTQLEFFKSMVDILTYSGESFNQNIIFKVIPNENTKHIYSLVQRQKKQSASRRSFIPTKYETRKPLELYQNESRRITREGEQGQLVPSKPTIVSEAFLSPQSRLNILNMFLLHPQGIGVSQLKVVYFNFYGQVLDIKLPELLSNFPGLFLSVNCNQGTLTLANDIYDHDPTQSKIHPFEASHLIPSATRRSIIQILGSFPTGLEPLEFFAKFEKRSGCEFDPSKYGFSSFADLVYSMPTIFSVVMTGAGDTPFLIKLSSTTNSNYNFGHKRYDSFYDLVENKSHNDSSLNYHCLLPDEQISPFHKDNGSEDVKLNRRAQKRLVKRMSLIKFNYLFHLIQHQGKLYMTLDEIASLFQRPSTILGFILREKNFPVLTLTQEECPKLFHQFKKYVTDLIHDSSVKVLPVKFAVIIFYRLAHPSCRQIISKLLTQLNAFDPNSLEWNDFSDEEQVQRNVAIRPPRDSLDSLCLSEVNVHLKKFEEAITHLRSRAEMEDALEAKVSFFENKIQKFETRKEKLENIKKEAKELFKNI